MRNAMRAAVAILALGLWQAPAKAETVQGTARVANRTSALPPGNWTKAAEVVTQRGYELGGPPSNANNLSAAFLRAHEGRVTGVILVAASLEPSSHFTGFTREQRCQRNDLFFIAVKADYPHDQDCVLLTHTRSVFGTQNSPFAEAGRDALRKAGAVPLTFLLVLTRRSDQMHVLAVTYLLTSEAGFAAEYAGWAQNGWHRNNLDAPRRAYMERMKVWAETAQEQTRLSFRNRPVTPLPEP